MQKKKRKKGSSIKGLIFVLVIFGLVGYYVYRTFTKSNLAVMVTVYKDWNTLPDAEVSIGHKKAITQQNGLALLDVRANPGDTLIVRAQYAKMLTFVSVIVNEERLNTGYTNADVVFKEPEKNPYLELFGKFNLYGKLSNK